MTGEIHNGAIDRNHPDSLYAQLRDRLRDIIESGDLKVNDKLPSERQLVAAYGVSRITVRQAIKELENLGYLQTRPGKGIYVAQREPRYELQVIRSFTQTAHANGRKPSGKLLCGKVEAASVEIARPLSLPAGAAVVFLERLRYLDNIPVLVQRDWFSASLAPGILDLAWNVDNRSLYRDFRDVFGVIPSRGQSTLSARLASDEEARLLELETPGAVLTLDQIAFDDRNVPVNISAMAYHPVRYPLSLSQSYQSSPRPRSP